MSDLGLQLELLGRLLAAAVLGGIIGLEREMHEHPAGMRTHLLVSLGSAAFTVLSVAAFELPPAPNGSIPTDPSRVAAQIVSGIGFLGAGAILKYGTTIKGLTTAASLWATAAIGMAAGVGEMILAVGGTAIIIVSLWPLHALLTWVRGRAGRVIQLDLGMDDLSPLARITGEASNRRIEISDIRTEQAPGGGYQLSLALRLPPGAVPAEVIQAFSGVEGTRLLSARRSSDAED